MRYLLALILLAAALPALAQEAAQQQSPEEERSIFISFIEDQLSTPNRRIQINGIHGVLSSEATIDEITVADRQGVWLRIVGASIDWSRSALIFRQRLEIARLAAQSIEVARQPLPAEGLPSPEARSFSVPQLPIAINLALLEVPSVSFGQDVFGLQSNLSVEGRLQLESGSLDTALQIERLDGPGGRLSLDAAFANDTRQVDLDFQLSEPQNGVVANLLNIEGRPPLTLTLAGSGPVESLDLSLTLAAAGEPALSGTARFREQPEGLGFTADLGGPVARLVPARFRGFFGSETRLTASGIARDGGGLSLQSLELSSAALHLTASAETANDGFLSALSLDADIADPAVSRVLLPVSGGETSVESGRLSVRFGGGGSDRWTASLNVLNLTTGSFAAERASFNASGDAANLENPAERRITFDAEGALTGITAERADVAEALGQTLRFAASGDWEAGEPLSLDAIEISGRNLVANLAGTVAEYAFRGDLGIKASDIAPFSGLAERDLGGSIDLEASGELRPVIGAFDLALDGTAEELRLGVAAADPLLTGATRITGRLARSIEGFSADDFRIESDHATFAAEGTFATDAADFSFDAALSDLALLTNRAQGRATATGRASGSGGALNLIFQAEVPQGTLLEKELTEARIGFDGTLQNGILNGEIAGRAFLDGASASLASRVALSTDARSLSGIDFNTAGARLTGDLTQDRGGLLAGDLSLEAPDISTAAALLLVEASGAVDAELSLEPRDGRQQARISATISDFSAERLSLGSGDLWATVDDLFGVPVVEGALNATELSAAGIDVAKLQANAETSGNATAFSGNAVLENGTNLSARGVLTPENGGYTVALDEAALDQRGVAARLVRPTRLTVHGDAITFEPVELDIAGGRLTAQGSIGQALSMAFALDGVPLSIANTIRPDLALGGTLDGRASLTGTRQTPQASFTLTGRDIVAAALREAGIASLALDATGETHDDVLGLNAHVRSPGGLNATVTGDVPLSGGDLALDADLQSFPLSLLNTRVRNQNLGGTLTGSARITGSLAEPEAAFDLRASAVTARALTSVGAAPLNVTASGTFAGRSLALEALNATGPSGLSISAEGRVPFSGTGFSVAVRGSVPLSLANGLLAERGTQLQGVVVADLMLGGSIERPMISGTISTTGASVVDPSSNLRLTGIRVDAALSGDAVTIRSASAALAGGGTVSSNGTISTNAAAGFPADLSLRLDHARYTDGEMVTATVTGNLRISGALTRDPLLSGRISVDRAEILVPESFAGAAADIPVRHIDPSPAVRETLRRARAEDGTPMPTSRPSIARLDVTVDAPARIFVRGRGLDAELGGSVRLTGPVTAVQPVGGFRLIRGRLSILTQRITFDEGTVTLVGDLDPFLDFVARSQGRDITVFITVRGRVSELSIDFSAQPELPEDEVLARLIFDRGVDQLSPLQLAQLAAAAAELAGGSNTSLLGSLRNATGLDDLDIVTGTDGNAAVRAGRYIQENIYLGVEAGSGGTTRGTINLDLTDSLTVRGGVGSKGDSDLGIFFERDY